MCEKIILKEMTLEQAREQFGIDSWGKWECEPSEFDWHYPEKETAYIFEGEVTVTAYGEDTHITGGMLVVFPAGMDCVWKVKRTIKKCYKSED